MARHNERPFSCEGLGCIPFTYLYRHVVALPKRLAPLTVNVNDGARAQVVEVAEPKAKDLRDTKSHDALYPHDHLVVDIEVSCYIGALSDRKNLGLGLVGLRYRLSRFEGSNFRRRVFAFLPQLLVLRPRDYETEYREHLNLVLSRSTASANADVNSTALTVLWRTKGHA